MRLQAGFVLAGEIACEVLVVGKIMDDDVTETVTVVDRSSDVEVDGEAVIDSARRRLEGD